VSQGAIGVVAVLLIALVLQDAFEVMLLPRRVERRIRFTRFYFQYSWDFWSWCVGRAARGRERLLSFYGPLSMVLLFGCWAAGLIIGFGLLDYAAEAGITPTDLSEQIYMSGVTFFTLGYGDIVPHGGIARTVSVIEAGTGIGFIATVISYLPVLYQFFARREAHVIQLDARAGSPPTAATMLERHAEPGGLAMLSDLLREWEIWGAELLESHLSYPMLVYYRSQHDNQSWLAALAAIMDTCALILIGIEDLPPLQARMTFTMARQILVEVSRTFGVRPSRYDGGDRLPHETYLRLQAILAEAGLHWVGGAAAEETLAALRATYEPLLDGLAKALVLRLPEWVAAEDARDHWERGHRGMIASRLIRDLADRAPEDLPEDGGGRRWRRWHDRLGR